MAQTIEDLGRAVKAKYPGQYDDLKDSEVGAKVKSKFPGSYDDYADQPSAPPSLKDQADQGIRDFIGGAASKLNPVNIVKGIGESAVAAYEHPVDTLLETFAHPYMALKRASEALKAGKPEEAAAHVASALTPGGMATEASQVKGATPGTRAEGLGELVGGGIATYLGAKAPEFLGAVKDKISAGASAVGDVAPDVVGIFKPRWAHIMRVAGKVSDLLGGDGSATVPQTAPEPDLWPGSNRPQPPPQSPPPIPPEQTAQGVISAANARMRSSMQASQSMAAGAQKAVPSPAAPTEIPDAVLNDMAKANFNTPFAKLGQAAQDVIRKAAIKAAQPEPPPAAPQPAVTVPPAPEPAVEPTTQTAAVPSVTPQAQDLSALSPEDKFQALRKSLVDKGDLPEKGTLGGKPARARFDEGGPSETVKPVKTVIVKPADLVKGEYGTPSAVLKNPKALKAAMEAAGITGEAAQKAYIEGLTKAMAK